MIPEKKHAVRILTFSLLLIFISIVAISQPDEIKWSNDGNSYFKIKNNELLKYALPADKPEVIATSLQLTPEGTSQPLSPDDYSFTTDEQKVLLFTNTKRVWRLNTRGDYWVLDLKTRSLTKIGRTLPAASLMFAKFSPDGKSVGYVSGNNIYIEDVATSQIRPLTSDGTTTLINGTFDWVYEEEFACRDGFRWSPDSKSIAYWQVDAGKIRKFYLINNTDSIYSRVIPIEYPKVGQKPSSVRLGVVNVADAVTTWLAVPGDPSENYLVRMEFIPFSGNLLIQQLNRKQNHSKLFIADKMTGKSVLLQEETDEAWVDIYQPGDIYTVTYINDFTWLNETRSILWASEKDGWRHFYQVSLDGKPESLLTEGNYDVIEFKAMDSKKGFVYFTASPDNATQKYLYRISLKRPGKAEKVTPSVLNGYHDYSISPNGSYALHSFSNYFTQPSEELISLPVHKPLNEKESITAGLDSLISVPNVEFFKIKTEDNVEMDGWIAKPKNFNPSKKYPVLFYVYTEPADVTVTDRFGVGRNPLYLGDLAEDGYIYVSLDNRGTPAPKGRAWRKAIYRSIGQINIHDQAMAAKEILKWDYIDHDRIAVWGWSGGGSATCNLMLQYPDIYKTGIAIAAVTNTLTYDNIYEERYMGLPDENMEDFVKGSPVTYAKNLKGNLLYIHGTGDDNVHYQNAEMLVNEFIKYNKQFQFMPYPNRTHGIYEGEGTTMHLATLFTNYLKTHCPPGPR